MSSTGLVDSVRLEQPIYTAYRLWGDSTSEEAGESQQRRGATCDDQQRA
jgi:hypothetical protein